MDVIKLNKYRHFYLYAKHCYKMTNRIEDLKKLVANYTGSDLCNVQIKGIINVLEDAVFELLEGKLNTHARIIRAIHHKSHPMFYKNGILGNTNPTIEEILIDAYIYILFSAEKTEISGELGTPSDILSLSDF